MKYFTPERYRALQHTDESAMPAADADWESAVDQYESYLLTIRSEMPESVRRLLDGFYLHDAIVLSMGRSGDQLCITLQLDVPPRDLLFVTYSLEGPPEINREAFPANGSPQNPQWLYDEIEQVRTGQQCYFVHSVLLSNGWEIHVPFRGVTVTTAAPVFPPPSSPTLASPTGVG
jgi:hypothetical protein